MSEMDMIFYDYEEFQKLGEEITERLQRMTMMQNASRWQFDHPDWYEKFERAMDDASQGWMSSHC